MNYITEMAELRLSNLFLRPLELFVTYHCRSNLSPSLMRMNTKNVKIRKKRSLNVLITPDIYILFKIVKNGGPR